MMVIFVGDQASAKNINPDVAFVGTQSYKRLLEWIWELDLDINDLALCNKNQVFGYTTCTARFIQTPATFVDIMAGDAIIALGNAASKKLSDLNLSHFVLPHPSGLNRKLNDKKYVKKILRECKKWIASQQS